MHPTTNVYGLSQVLKADDTKEGQILLDGAKIEAKAIKSFQGELIKIQPWCLPSVLLTPDHLVRIRKGWRKYFRINNKDAYRWKLKEKVWMRADQLHKKQGRNQLYLEVPIVTTEKAYSFDFYDRRRFKADSKWRYEKADKDWAFLFGLYVAEGNTTRGEIIFSLGKHEEELAAKLRSLIRKKLERQVKTKPCSNTPTATRTSFYSKSLSAFLSSNFGRIAPQKTIPRWMLEERKEILQSFVDGYVAGDGCRIVPKQKNSYPHYQVKSASEELIRRLQIALLKLGKVSSFAKIKVPDTEIEGRIIRSRGFYWRLVWMETKRRNLVLKEGNSYYFPIRRLEKLHYSGPVVDLQTTSKVIPVPFLIHNCWIRRTWYGKMPPVIEVRTYGLLRNAHRPWWKKWLFKLSMSLTEWFAS